MGAPHLFSVEQKNCTHGLVLPLSGAGGRYMASEKHVSNSFSSSILGEGVGNLRETHQRTHEQNEKGTHGIGEGIWKLCIS